MSNHNANIIGVDVSGEHLDGHRLRDGESRRFANDGRGIRALVRWAGPEVVGVVYEATSSYHRDLEAALFKAELPALRVNPRRAREFARASGMLAKTDRVDAMMLARMGAALEIEPARELSPARRELASSPVCAMPWWASARAPCSARSTCATRTPGAPRPATSATCGARSRRWNGASTS